MRGRIRFDEKLYSGFVDRPKDGGFEWGRSGSESNTFNLYPLINRRMVVSSEEDPDRIRSICSRIRNGVIKDPLMNRGMVVYSLEDPDPVFFWGSNTINIYPDLPPCYLGSLDKQRDGGFERGRSGSGWNTFNQHLDPQPLYYVSVDKPKNYRFEWGGVVPLTSFFEVRLYFRMWGRIRLMKAGSSTLLFRVRR